MRACLRALPVAIAILGAPPAAAQQGEGLLTPPANPVVPNVNGVPIGPYGGLETGAYVARVDDPSAAWFNPAGLSRAKTAQLSGNAGLYQFTTVAPAALPDSGSALQQLPNLVGFVLRASARCTLGVAVLTTNSWEQETNSQILSGSAASGARFGYSADADFSKRYLGLGAGCERDRWRLGGGLAFSLTSLRLVDTVSNRIGSATGLQTELLSTRRSGDAVQLRPILGVQFDPSAAWRLGLVVRTPAMTLHHSGEYSIDGTLQSGAASVGLSFFDSDASFTYKMPWEFQGGVGYVGKRAQAEVDVQAFTSISDYLLLASDQSVFVYADSGQGTPPTIQSRPFPGATTSARAFANVNVGGHYRFSPNRSYLLHAGFTTDLSPVGPDDAVFDQVDLYGWTIGLSGEWSKLQFAAGVNIRRGTSTQALVRDLVTGEVVTTTIEIRTAALIYSIAYQF
ncbi:MAG TPA: hypothetical protein VLT86_07260 [Vicinamibacterales bacterium]|nr:hypothetical protein [Vicinamibacterales bacterium]